MGFSINTITVDGNLTRDPELRSLPSGASVCSLRIAHNERYKNNTSGVWEDRPNYFDVTIWGGQGEWLARNIQKGDKVIVSGKLKWREWEARDGSKRQAVDINAFDVIPAERGGGGGGQRSGSGFEGRTDAGFQARGDAPIDDRDFQAAPAATPTPDDDIPF